MSYNKLDYQSLSIPQLLIEVDDLISCHLYTTPEDFGEDEFFEGEARKMLDVIRKKYREEHTK